MDGLRGFNWFLAIVLGVAVVVIGSRTFLNYSPPIPEASLTAELPAEGTRAERQQSSSTRSELVDDRVDRLQSVIRRQRSQLAALRADPDRPALPTITRKKSAEERPGLLSQLSKLSGLTPDDTAELSKDELSSQLLDLRDLTMKLRDQLENAEAVVDMQAVEIEDLSDEIETTRERLTELVEDSEDLDVAVEGMLTEAKDIEQTARNVLVGLGPSAAAMLLSMADDDRAHVRNWIRAVIEQITTDREEEP